MKLFDAFQKCTHGEWKTAGLDVQYRVEADADATRVYFQCTRSRLDWFLNLFAFPLGNYHRGYRLAFLSCLVDVLIDIQSTNPKRVEVYGYSLGGPTASQFVNHLSWYYDSEVIGATFGSPRYYRKDNPFVHMINYRVRGDLLAAAFPRWLGWRDVGRNVWLGKESRLSVKNHEPEKYRYLLKKFDAEGVSVVE